DDELSIAAQHYDPPTWASFCGGYVGATYTMTDTTVMSEVNSNPPNPYNDQGIFARLDPSALTFYGLNYDEVFGKVQMIHFYGTGYANMPSFNITPANQTIDLKLCVRDVGSEVYLVGQAWSGTTMLGECQAVVDGTTPFDGYTVPVLASGASGVYAMVNSNYVLEGIGPDDDLALQTRMDDWSVTDVDVLYPGDFNMDGKVDVSDLGILAGSYGATTGKTWSNGDANLNGAVDVEDLGILAGNYGYGVTAAAAVPEPSMLCLLGLGALSLLLRRR
ncbi:MAG: PEP-CTERM sorting domain-containing protein, partial [Pirellulales bacterium]|nr:PEP-CTERM sorting domain-containing protein [Pirellulales bacterium]